MDQVARYKVKECFVRYFDEVAGGSSVITSIAARNPSGTPGYENGSRTFSTFFSPYLR